MTSLPLSFTSFGPAGRAAALWARRRPDRVTWALIGLSLLAAGLVLLRTSFHGIGLNNDSINFIGLARNILAGNGMVEVLATETGERNPYVLWGPLYSLLLTAFSFGVFDPYRVAAPLNAVILGLTVFAVGYYLKGRLKSRFVFWWAALAAASSLPLIWMASFAMSDALFILMTVLALIYGDKFLGDGKTSSLIGTAAFSALAWQTRYVGLALPVTIGLLLLFWRDAAGLLRARRVLVYSAIVALPMALWVLRTYLHIGEPVGNRLTVEYPLWQLFGDIRVALAEGWERILLIPLVDRVPGGVWAGMGVLALAAAGALAGGLWQGRRGAEWPGRPLAVFGGFMLVYMAVIVGGVAAGYSWHGVVGRYFVPLWLPLLVTAALVLDTAFGLAGRRADFRPARAATAGLGAALCLGIAVMLAADVWDTNRIRQINLSYTSVLSESDTLRHIRNNPVDGAVYSNAPLQVYFFTDGEADYRFIPKSREGGYIIDHRNAGISGVEQLRRWVGGLSGGEYVVWLHGWYGSDLYDFGPAEMRALPGLELVADLADGVILQVNGRALRETTSP